ncbi:hypothetical protein Lbir_2907 [Legionella birminghamensis]|uniref:Uncharacterized protein n=1 Tax=Legionella birminghamensis TaxID=28083 RepID=A0A378I814_9GAMM|nr:hypothetical protein [Legionella birminghamensis]KTC68305.1 hypothetical protein Lbir_2907 [Legionella birminghamensis]STX30982.1 Uncharacterised protein [Legionella birminghamensis]
MNNLQDILLAIGKLPIRDQQWVLSKLPETSKRKLDKAQSHPRESHPPELITDTSLPVYCNDLAGKDRLYIAIVLEQGQFIWKERFLSEFSLFEELNLLEESLKNISDSSKKILYEEWVSTTDAYR